MRKLLPPVLAIAACALLATGAAAQTFSGLITTRPCDAGTDAAAMGAELYAFKIADANTGWDTILADLQHKAGSMGNVGGADISGPTWSVPPNFSSAVNPTDVVFVVATYNDGTMFVNGGEAGATGGDPGLAPVHPVGAGIPSAWGIRNGQDIVPEAVGTNSGIQFRFAPVPEVTGNAETFGMFNCQVGGRHGFMGAMDFNGAAATYGAIAGYVILRIPDAGGMPTPQDFYDATVDGNPATGGVAGFVTVHGWDLGAADTGGRPGGGDPDDGDLGGLNNPDQMGYTGDDQLVFQDTETAPGGAARALPQPVAGTTYWYAAMPVVGTAPGTTIDSLNGVGLGSTAAWTAATSDTTGDGNNDAADLDGDGTIEFWSPQADFGIGGLGLTNGSLPLLSTPVSASIDPAAAGGDIEFSGSLSGGDVNIQFTSALEAGNVLGFNVFRMAGDHRIPVNDEPILATGGEGTVYSLVDATGSISRRMVRGGSFEYVVEILYNDGTPSQTVGPFEVTLSGDDRPVRRRR